MPTVIEFVVSAAFDLAAAIGMSTVLLFCQLLVFLIANVIVFPIIFSTQVAFGVLVFVMKKWFIQSIDHTVVCNAEAIAYLRSKFYKQQQLLVPLSQRIGERP